jgi:hypothetical protein
VKKKEREEVKQQKRDGGNIERQRDLTQINRLIKDTVSRNLY